MKNVVVLTGAGISADSGLATFRGDGGLWEGYNVYDVATPEAWLRNRELVLRFYNWRRHQVRRALPNKAHHALVELEQFFNVSIITQNVDDLHERAGSTNVLHLHGEILKARSEKDASLVIELGDRDIHPGDTAVDGSALRPHIVWFGEEVPCIFAALDIAQQADILMVIGTSLQVYPAASIMSAATAAEFVYVINPKMPPGMDNGKIIRIEKKAREGVPALVRKLVERCAT